MMEKVKMSSNPYERNQYTGIAEASARPALQGVLVSHADAHETNVAYTEKLAEALSGIADRLLGTQPEDMVQKLPTPGNASPNSYVHAFGVRNQRLSYALEKIQSAVNRLDGAL